eukprot:TRINITY_DN670_c0_g1_i2.p1 TRINITY_DN670_c0_g1~~TRINITY_DN670_c0_g1_i2.p1  ORF type:complete len:1189 (-),score=349.07 TRINITY_DN670_c0_g1_i2:263-3829(-)
MYLYSLTLQPSRGINCCIYGNFSNPKAQEVIISRGKSIELLRPSTETAKLHSICYVEVFGVVRSLVPFRLTGTNKDYVIVGTDSGRISILEYNEAKSRFDSVHLETFGKTGCRRIVPGQYLATDPQGRAVMIGAIEKQKLVYILNRDTTSHLTISSPLEAHKSHTLVFDMVGVDVGFENPIFACIEVDYQKAEDEGEKVKSLTYYELDLGLNHVVRKWSEEIPFTSNRLIAVPGGASGPGGVLICSENTISYKNQGHKLISVPVPRRRTLAANRSLLITCHVTIKQKTSFFFLVQSEEGDLYKVTLDYDDDVVSSIDLRYFDTVPVATSMCFLRTGFLFLAAEFGDHALYQIQSLGDGAEPAGVLDSSTGHYYLEPHALEHLGIMDTLDSMSPAISQQVGDLVREGAPQLYTASGRGAQSSMRVLRHGLPVSEFAVTDLPATPTNVWTVKKHVNDEFDAYIVISFVNATLVLSIGETVEEVSETESGLIPTTSTIEVLLVGDDSLVQIHPGGIRHIRADKRIHEWKSPGRKTIVHAAANSRQVVIALSGGELVYFELDRAGLLAEISKVEMKHEISCLSIAPVPQGRLRSRFLAVGDWNNTVRILSLDPDDCLQSLSVQSVRAQASSLCVVQFGPTLYLNIGLQTGELLRTVLDSVTGDLTDTRRRYLGVTAPRLRAVTVQGTPAMLGLSSRPWMLYPHHGRIQLTPISYPTLAGADTFCSEQCRDGIVGVSENTLRIVSIDRVGEEFNQIRIPLRYTPRAFAIHPLTNNLIIAEADHNSAQAEEGDIKSEKANGSGIKAEGEDMDTGDDDDEEEDEDEAMTKWVVRQKPGAGQWASCIRILDVANNKTNDLIELTDNECAVSVCTCYFHGNESEPYIIVGTAKDVSLHPRSCSSGFLYVYYLENATKFTLLHKTEVDDVPTALCPFQGRLLVGLGKVLRIYDLGKKRLLRKCENKQFPSLIKTIHTMGDRIYVGDLSESIHYVTYKRSENQLYLFADDITPRWVTASTLLDFDTVASADKFGNIFVCRLPKSVSEDLEDDVTGSKMSIAKPVLQGAPYKLEEIVQFHVGETVTSINKCSLVPGRSEVLVYSTISGGIGALLPFISQEDVYFFSHLEMYMRQQNPPLCGRDHLSYRSYYFPVKNVIDGDLCEQYSSLDVEIQQQIAEEMERQPSDVLKKLEDIRTLFL